MKLGPLAAVVVEYGDVVPIGFRRKKTVDSACLKAVFPNQFFEIFECLVVKLLRFGGSCLILGFENLLLSIPNAAQLPCMEKRCPVDVIDEIDDLRFHSFRAREGRHRSGIALPIEFRRRFACLFDGKRFLLRTTEEILACLLLLFEQFLHKTLPPVLRQQRGGDRHRARGIKHMDNRPAVVLGDLDCGVRGGGRRTANEQRNRESTPLHFLGDMHHLIQRRCDQPGEPDHVAAHFGGLCQNLVTGNHHAHIGDFEAVAG